MRSNNNHFTENQFDSLFNQDINKKRSSSNTR